MSVISTPTTAVGSVSRRSLLQCLAVTALATIPTVAALASRSSDQALPDAFASEQEAALWGHRLRRELAVTRDTPPLAAAARLNDHLGLRPEVKYGLPMTMQGPRGPVIWAGKRIPRYPTENATAHETAQHLVWGLADLRFCGDSDHGRDREAMDQRAAIGRAFARAFLAS